MKKVVLALLFGLMISGCSTENPSVKNESLITESDKVLESAFLNKASDLQVQGAGKVIALLPDDLEGSAHQKFILELSTEQTLLISHNIDLAAKIDTLQLNDIIEFYGEYEWNSKGGVVHWTHNDPEGVHENGWLKHNGVIYQ